MDKTQFISLMKETLEIEDRELQLEDNFRELPEWTSLAYLMTISMIDDEYNVIISADEFKTLTTLGDIAKVIDDKRLNS